MQAQACREERWCHILSSCCSAGAISGKREWEEGASEEGNAEELLGMLAKKSFLSRQEDETTGELAGLLQKPSALEVAHTEQFKSFGG